MTPEDQKKAYAELAKDWMASMRPEAKIYSDEDIEGLAYRYCKENYEGEPLTTRAFEDCFETAFKLGTKCNSINSSANVLKIGELFIQQGELLFHYGDKVSFINVVVESVDNNTTHNGYPTQSVETCYIFDNEDRTILMNREIIVMYDGRTPIPMGTYDLSDYLIAKALHDKTN